MSIQKIQVLLCKKVLKYGSLVKVKVDNMRNQHEAQVEKEAAQVSKPAEEKEYALIAWWLVKV